MADDVYEIAFERTIGLEGGYVDHPQDRGGPTKYGLSKRSNPDLDIPNLTLEQAKQIYKERYWDRLNLISIPYEILQLEIFDTAVNCGLRMAQLIVQRSLNFLGEGLSEDGIMGPRTIDALNRWTEKDCRAVFKCLNGFQFIYYVRIIENDPRQKVFARGWMKRIQDYREEAQRQP